MAEEYKAGYPLAPTDDYSRSDQEAGKATSSDELKSQKRKKWLLYGVAFVIFQTGIIVLFTFTVMKFRTPHFRIRSATFGSPFDVQITTTTPSFNISMNAALGVKNTNFGPYKYQNSAITFFYNGTPVGGGVIGKSKASFRSTKKFNVDVNLASNQVSQAGNAELGKDLNSGILPLTSHSTLNGKVEIMLIFKKKKAVDLDCTMDVNIATKELQNVQCN